METFNFSNVAAAPPVPQTAFRPPSHWTVAFWAAIAVTAAIMAMSVGRLFVLFADRDIISRLTNGDNVSLDEAAGVARVEDLLAIGNLIVLICYPAAVVVLTRLTQQLLTRHRIDPKRVLRYRGSVAVRVVYLVMTVAFLFYSPKPPSVDSLRDPAWLAFDDKLIAFTSVRIVLSLWFFVPILILRRRTLRALAAGPTIPSTVDFGEPQPPPQSALLASHGIVTPSMTGPAATGPVPADGSFWDRVSQLRESNAGDLPLLELQPTSVRRWHLVTSVESVAATLTPGSAVIVYPPPPQVPNARTLGRTAGMIRACWRSSPSVVFLGIIETNGVLAYEELSTEDQLMSWLTRAGESDRCGAYRADAPDALAAVVLS